MDHESLFLYLTGEKEIDYQVFYGYDLKGMDRTGVVKADTDTHQYWQAKLTREFSGSQRKEVEAGAKISDIQPKGDVKTLKFITGIAFKDGTNIATATTKLTDHTDKTVDDLVRTAVHHLDGIWTFIMDKDRSIVRYLNPGFDVNYARTLIPIAGEEFTLAYRPHELDEVRISKYLQDDSWYGDAPHVEFLIRSVGDINTAPKNVLTPLEYHKKRLSDALLVLT